MPKLRQPATLQKMALDAIFQYVVLWCNRTSVEGSLDELTHGISVMKTNVICRLPWFMVADFSARFMDFLSRFYCAFNSLIYIEATLELFMDIEIVGLQFRGPMVDFLDPRNGWRLRRLVELDLDYVSHSISMNLQNFYLNDLTCFMFARRCTDLDLSVIGRNCPKLQVIRVSKSRRVTDKGLASLSQCSDLRFIDVHKCSVTHSGLNRMLLVHKKLEKITDVAFDTMCHLDWSVCPSINHFATNDRVSAKHLRKIVTKFPNITYLYMHGKITENLYILQNLNELTGLDLKFSLKQFDNEVRMLWTNIMGLLRFIGANLTTLKLGSCDTTNSGVGIVMGQDKIDYIFNTCPNLECFKFVHKEKLIVIPSFAKLKVLTPQCSFNYDDYPLEILCIPTIKFNKLPNLESLSLYHYDVSCKTVRSIMLDNDKFPKLSVIKDVRLRYECLEELRRIARMKNLKFEIINGY
ncbi:uncharacterized protein LOC124188063 isoform X4 [Neodiprion fabricii]|uniref:uncharacterized protein LOC124188063 isoform X4 n=1 Tax=Neodiprion fabricii TaxID=2872261 RepID=UPI001ED8DAAE|nr:uncharacterized protein LOC124188063 isoform X4 [Neodiprion fabricii]XP_046436346.1 uncharacterized protein LOC124188063 isoform X4 [Neodiprion fabricii]XP_046436347.1 uncharacterized protein LOC124188063 isoform X4 [Neodiprion fabricii]XP_046436348.1 uncharacterized protein LOC124188063 isoform X4 [Neodiprion fabricii]